MKGFSLIAKPLFALTENQIKFVWTKQSRDVANLKQTLTSSLILSFPSEKKLILDTDASDHEVGAVLSQVQRGTEKVIAYYSRVLNKTERNYCVTRRELLPIVDLIKSFHHYMYWRKFLVCTVHASLRWLVSFKDLESQLARWAERLQQYDFEIVRGSRAHKNADGLSRRLYAGSKCKYCLKVEVTNDMEREEQIAWIILKEDVSEGRCSEEIN